MCSITLKLDVVHRAYILDPCIQEFFTLKNSYCLLKVLIGQDVSPD